MFANNERCISLGIPHRLELPNELTANIHVDAFKFADVDNDGCNELVVGHPSGLLVVYKGAWNYSEQWIENLLSINVHALPLRSLAVTEPLF